jgi:fibronectin type 3 domain-containing protein
MRISCRLLLLVSTLCAALGCGNVINNNHGHSVSLTWTASTTSGVTYKVYRGAAHLGPYSPIASNVTATSYTDANVQVGQSYYYVTTAVDASNTESVASDEASAAIPNP